MNQLCQKLKYIPLILSVSAAYAWSAPSQIVEVHPVTLYPVTLELKSSSSTTHTYEPIPETPEHSKNICEVKPSACSKEVINEDDHSYMIE